MCRRNKRGRGSAPKSPQRNAALFRELGGTDGSRNGFVDSSLALRYSCSEVGDRVKESL
jgi:hypothetical protein